MSASCKLQCAALQTSCGADVCRVANRYGQDLPADLASLKPRDRAVALLLHTLVTQGHLHAHLVTVEKREWGMGERFEGPESACMEDSELTLYHVFDLQCSKAEAGCCSEEHWRFEEDIHEATEVMQVTAIPPGY